MPTLSAHKMGIQFYVPRDPTIAYYLSCKEFGNFGHTDFYYSDTLHFKALEPAAEISLQNDDAAAILKVVGDKEIVPVSKGRDTNFSDTKNSISGLYNTSRTNSNVIYLSSFKKDHLIKNVPSHSGIEKIG